MFASIALVVAWTAINLTDYSDYLTGFHKPLSPPYISHWFETLSSTISDSKTNFLAAGT